MPTLAEQLAEYIVQCDYRNLPEPVIEQAKYCLLDAVGVGIASCEKPWCRAVLGLVRKHGGTAEATVWYHGDRLPDLNAVLMNATSVHSMDFNDDLAGIQVGGIIAPTVLAMAESVGATGKEAITAMALGYDVAARVAVAANSEELYLRGLQPTAVFGSFAAVAVAGKLLGLDAKTLANAFGIAGSYAGGTIEFLNEGTDTKRYHVAKAAHGGVISAHLAAGGMTGPTSIFEGEYGVFQAYSKGARPEKLLEALGERYVILETSVKRFPFCDGNAPPLEAALSIVQEHGLRLDDIAKVHVRMKSFLIPYVINYHGDSARKYRPQVELDAQMSLPYCLSIGLHRNGDVRLEDFDPERFADAEVLALADKVTAEGDAEMDKVPLMPMSMPAIATLSTTDGREFSKRVDHQKGDSRNPFSAQDFKQKFSTCVAGRLSDANRDRAIDMILKLEDANNVAGLTALLVKS